MIHQQPKKTLLQSPGLWLPDREVKHPWHLPSRSSRGFARRCCCGEEEPCSCTHCSGRSPCCWQITISGIVDDACGDCDCLNGTFFAGSESTGCSVSERFTPLFTSICGETDISVDVTFTGGDYKITIAIGDNTWEKNYGGTKPDCINLADESIPYLASSDNCDGSSSTCLLTALDTDGSLCANTSGCFLCECERMPDKVKVTFPALVDSIPNPPGPDIQADCVDCADFEGEYILSNDVFLSDCVWGLLSDDLPCEATEIAFTVAGGSFFLTHVVVQFPSGGMLWNHNYGEGLTEIDCINNLSKSLSYNSETPRPTECYDIIGSARVTVEPYYG